MPDLARQYTVDEVLAFPEDGNRYELVDGELLVTPSPRQPHQAVLSRLHLAVGPFVRDHAVGQVFFAPADVFWQATEYVQPDLFVVPTNQVTGDWRDITTLLLAVEVVSPASSRADRLAKRRLYQRMGVPTYWVVDPDARLVEVWQPDDERPEIVTERLTWRPADAPELVIELTEIW
ncbi:MAG: Uma2 family endonuclease [Gemmatimonadales bacterium]